MVVGLAFAYDLPAQLRIATSAIGLLDALFPQAISLVLIVLALIESQRGARHDLVEPRRRLRVFLMTSVAVYAAVVAVVEIALRNEPAPQALEVAHVGLMIVVALSCAYIFTRHGAMLFAVPRPVSTKESEAGSELQRIEQWLKEKGFVEPELTVGGLAKTLGTQEYKLRRILNSELGFRNFMDFIHQHRIREACDRLVDPEAADLSILSMSLDLGYNSLATFNRAFKRARNKWWALDLVT